LVADGLLHVLPLTPAELEAACTGPARRVGVHLEPELVAELTAEVADHPGALPLLQYMLTELFDRRVGDRMTLHAYRELGGIQGLVGRRAEETFTTLDEATRATCRQVFLRLVVVGEEGEVGHRRVERDDLDSLTAGPGVVGTILDRFAAARLLVLDRDAASGRATVQMAHEALLRAWPRLQRWIDDSQDDLRLQRWLTAAASDWLDAAHDDDFLLTGARLDLAQEWRARATAAATQREHAFIDASLARRERERVEAESQHRRELELERRATSRLRAFVAVLALAALVAGARDRRQHPTFTGAGAGGRRPCGDGAHPGPSARQRRHRDPPGRPGAQPAAGPARLQHHHAGRPPTPAGAGRGLALGAAGGPGALPRRPRRHRRGRPRGTRRGSSRCRCRNSSRWPRPTCTGTSRSRSATTTSARATPAPPSPQR
jgi:hypothetical protein